MRVPLLAILGRVIHTGQPAQVAVERRDLILLPHGLQPGVEHDVGQLQAALIQLSLVPAPQEERQGAPVQLVGAADQRARFLYILERLLGGQGLAHGLLGEVVQVRLQHVLRRGHQGQAQHRVLGHLVEQGVDRIALARLAREVAGGGRRAQSVGNHDPVRHAVEVPQPLVHVRARLAKEQPLAEIPPAGLFNLALFRLLGIACQGVEAFAVFCLVADQGGVRVEPAQQPVVDAGGIQALGLDAGIGQAADQSVADHVQGLLGRLPSAAAGAAGTAVRHHPHAAALPTPAQPSHDGVLKQAAGLGDSAQVVGKEA